MALNRVRKEYQALLKEDVPNLTAGPISDTDMFHWKATILGPENTPYAGGTYAVDIRFPADYPFKPPRIQFTTRIFHPNINNNGGVCLGILKEKWSPALSISRVLQIIIEKLSNPSLDENPLAGPPADLYVSDRINFNNTAYEWARRYAQAA